MNKCFQILLLLIAIAFFNFSFAKKKGVKVLKMPADFAFHPHGNEDYDAKNLSTFNWYVYSDRDDNTAYTKANVNSKVNGKVKFLEKYIVTDVKGNFLHLYKFDLTKLVSSKKGITTLASDAEEIGWMEKSKLLLWRHALYSDKNVITKALPVVQSNELQNLDFKNGKILVYSNPYGNKAENQLSLDITDVLFVYKNEINNRILVGKSCIINSMDCSKTVVGWVDKKKVKKWEGRIYLQPNWEPEAVAERKKANIKSALFENFESAAAYRQTGTQEGNIWDRDPYEIRLSNAKKFPVLEIKDDLIETCIWGGLTDGDVSDSINYYIYAYTSIKCLKVNNSLFKRVVLLSDDEFDDINHVLRTLTIDEGEEAVRRSQLLHAVKKIISINNPQADYRNLTIAYALEFTQGIKSGNKLLSSIKVEDLPDKQKLKNEDFEQLIEYFEKIHQNLSKIRNNSDYMSTKNNNIWYWVPEDFFP